MHRNPDLPEELVMTPEEIEEYQAEVRRLQDARQMDKDEVIIVNDDDIVVAGEPNPDVIAKVKKAVYKNDEEMLIAIIKGIDTNARNWGIARGKQLAEESKSDQVVHRDATTGQFVDEDRVKADPEGTVTEHD